MVLMTHHNPLEGVSFRVIGVARDTTAAKEVLRHYYSGVPMQWEELLSADKFTLIRWVNKDAGVCYVIQEVEVF